MSEVSGTTYADSERHEVSDMPGDVQLQFGGELSEEEREQLRFELRDKCKRSLYFFAKGVLGFDKLTKRTHREYADFLQDLSKKKTLDLMPRGTYKTSIGTIAFAMWYLLHYPDHYICIANQTAGNAERMLLEIEGHLEGRNPVMNWLFPEMIRPHSKWKPWSSDKMTIPNRTVISGTPSITALGVGAKAESQHFHVIIVDDPIGEKALASQAVMLDAISWHDYMESLFVSPEEGVERMHGTRWGPNDLYGIVKERPEFEVYEKAAEDDEGNLLFPELLSRETLRRLMAKNYLMASTQYYNKVLNPETLDFNPNWLETYVLLPDEEWGPYCLFGGERYYVKDMNVALFIDPAGSGDVDVNIAKDIRRAQFKLSNNAVGVWGLHGTGRYFLLDLWFGRAKGENPELQIATKMYEMFVRWRGFCTKGYVEGYGAQGALITVFNMLCDRYGERFPMEEIGRGVIKAKNVRVRTFLGSAAQNGLITIRRSHDKFKKEFTEFPNGTTQDTLDMSVWAFYKLRKPYSDAEQQVAKAANNRRKSALVLRTGAAGY